MCEHPPGTKPRYFGDYELLEEIARGGTTVVYRARQLGLDRTVVLKLITAGRLASTEEVQRFHAEAEAAATLDHPGIVPIHKVGMHDGQLFFSMGVVEGQSLAERIESGPLVAEEAASLTKKVAEVIAYAHEHGVIHRDLKPANVLLDRDDEPRLMDFGLAKQVVAARRSTVMGQILGAANSMSPEQAAAKADRVGEASDVYSLGAILYASLTGCPPFQGNSVPETLMQVLEQEPVKPRQIDARIPRDLETISLKCLAKDPRQRYGSAQELVEDLERFLKGERIVARRRQPLLESRAFDVGWTLIGMVIGAVIVGLLGHELSLDNAILFISGGICGGVLAGIGVGWDVVVVPLLLLGRTRSPLTRVALGLGVTISSLAFRLVPGLGELSGQLLEEFFFLPHLLSTTGNILAVIGPVLCLSVSPGSRARGALHAAVLLQVIVLVIRLTHGSLILLEVQLGLSSATVDVLALVSGVSFLLFVVFLGHLAGFLDDPELERRAGRLLVLSVAGLFLAAASILGGTLWPPLVLLSVVPFFMGVVIVQRFYLLTRDLQLSILRSL